MSKRIPPSSKNKKGEPLQTGAHDQGGIPQSPGGTGAASEGEGACGQSSTTPEDRRHSKQSQHSDGHGDVDDGASESSQTSGGRSKSGSSKHSKKKKKGKEGKQKHGEKEGAEGQQRTRRTSVFKRFKKSSQGSQPPLSPNEPHLPQRHHTPSEGSEESEVPAKAKKVEVG